MSQKVFVTSRNVIVLTCPKCSQSKTSDVSKYMPVAGKVRMKVKCSCGNRFQIQLDRRKYYRKKTHLPGIYISENEGRRGAMTVIDVSLGGLKFKVNVKPAFLVGDTLLVEFALDDLARTPIREKVVVRSINGLEVGAEFLAFDTSKSANKSFGFYLLV